jgi:hypothetical protein
MSRNFAFEVCIPESVSRSQSRRVLLTFFVVAQKDTVWLPIPRAHSASCA